MAGRRETYPYAKEPALAFELSQAGNINPQTGSKLLSSIPAEIVNEIFGLILTFDQDKYLQYDRTWSQYTKTKPDLSLLYTCKRVYLMAFRLPYLLNPLKGNLFHYDRLDSVCPMLEKLRMWQFSLLTSVDIVIDQRVLENHHSWPHAFGLGSLIDELRIPERHDGTLGAGIKERLRNRNPNNLSVEDFRPFPVQKIQKLTLRLSHMAWWPVQYAYHNAPIALDPACHFSGRNDNSAQQEMMNNAQERENTGGLAAESDEDTWGAAISRFLDLKTLELKMEVQKGGREAELDQIIDCAKSWTFPLGPNVELRWNGNVEKYARDMNPARHYEKRKYKGKTRMVSKKMREDPDLLHEIRGITFERVNKVAVAVQKGS